jgi:hypothetical protein
MNIFNVTFGVFWTILMLLIPFIIACSPIAICLLTNDAMYGWLLCFSIPFCLGIASKLWKEELLFKFIDHE